MKVKLLTGMVRMEKGRSVSYPAGASIAVPNAEAGRLIESGQAVSAETGRSPKARKGKAK